MPRVHSLPRQRLRRRLKPLRDALSPRISYHASTVEEFFHAFIVPILLSPVSIVLAPVIAGWKGKNAVNWLLGALVWILCVWGFLRMMTFVPIAFSRWGSGEWSVPRLSIFLVSYLVLVPVLFAILVAARDESSRREANQDS